MEKRETKLIIDRLLGIAVILTLAIIISYFLVAPKIHHTNALVPSQTFLFTSRYLLILELVSYFVVFVIKVVAFIFNKELFSRFSTSLVFDFIVILLGVIVPSALLI